LFLGSTDGDLAGKSQNHPHFRQEMLFLVAIQSGGKGLIEKDFVSL
jgi:hypothetical protein